MAQHKAISRPEPTELDFLKLLDFSLPGAGKTSLLGTTLEAPEIFFPAMLLDFEAGTIPLRGMFDTFDLKEVLSGDAEFPTDRISRIRVKTWAELDSLQQALHDQIRTGKFPWRSIFIDSLSEIAYIVMKDVIAEDMKSHPKRDPEVPEMGDYQLQQIRLRKLVRDYRDLLAHVVFNCLAVEATTPSGILQWRPALPKSLIPELPGLIHAMGFLAVVEDDRGERSRELFFEQSPKMFVKSRYSNFLPSVERPTMLKLFNLMQADAQEVRISKASDDAIVKAAVEP